MGFSLESKGWLEEKPLTTHAWQSPPNDNYALRHKGKTATYTNPEGIKIRVIVEAPYVNGNSEIFVIFKGDEREYPHIVSIDALTLDKDPSARTTEIKPSFT